MSASVSQPHCSLPAVAGTSVAQSEQFGNEQTPHDLDTIADLQKLAPILLDRGYTDPDINAIFHRNWLRFFREALPPS